MSAVAPLVLHRRGSKPGEGTAAPVVLCDLTDVDVEGKRERAVGRLPFFEPRQNLRGSFGFFGLDEGQRRERVVIYPGSLLDPVSGFILRETFALVPVVRVVLRHPKGANQTFVREPARPLRAVDRPPGGSVHQSRDRVPRYYRRGALPSPVREDRNALLQVVDVATDEDPDLDPSDLRVPTARNCNRFFVVDPD